MLILDLLLFKDKHMEAQLLKKKKKEFHTIIHQGITLI